MDKAQQSAAKIAISQAIGSVFEWGTKFDDTKLGHKIVLRFLAHRGARTLSDFDKNKIASSAVTAINATKFQVPVKDVSVVWSKPSPTALTTYQRLNVTVCFDVDVPDVASHANTHIDFTKATIRPAPIELKCHYCGNVAEYSTTSSFLYWNRDYGPVYFCRCKPDGVYVGCHKGTSNPLGILADSGLRLMRMECHKVFDPYWKVFESTTSNKKMVREKRNETYAHLADIMKIDREDCHISHFDEELVKKAMVLIKAGKLDEKVGSAIAMKVKLFTLKS